ncbi:MAG: phosphoribosyltransferase [Candidatus Thermoplasmatota archaeon]|jgi:hypoxanthine phosphoribosyltransferase|nr:phosphoribosyltransferase [Candidatus Thermoplasmatota archaeon]
MQFKAKLVSWNEIETWCDSIREKVSLSFKPDTIVGISRGGLVPGRILSDMMWIKDLQSVKTEHWGLTATVDGKASIKNRSVLFLEKKRVLLVDDITDTGESMTLAKEYISEFSPMEVRTAALLHINRSRFVPDFYAEEIDNSNWTWFIFPWNIHEDLDNLSGRTMVSPMTTSELKAALKNDYDLDIANNVLEHVLTVMERTGRISKSGTMWKKS